MVANIIIIVVIIALSHWTRAVPGHGLNASDPLPAYEQGPCMFQIVFACLYVNVYKKLAAIERYHE